MINIRDSILTLVNVYWNKVLLLPRFLRGKTGLEGGGPRFPSMKP